MILNSSITCSFCRSCLDLWFLIKDPTHHSRSVLHSYCPGKKTRLLNQAGFVVISSYCTFRIRNSYLSFVTNKHYIIYIYKIYANVVHCILFLLLYIFFKLITVMLWCKKLLECIPLCLFLNVISMLFEVSRIFFSIQD